MMSRRQKEDRGSGPEPMKTMCRGVDNDEVGRKVEIREVSRRERSM
jgi:hypothetical protein